MREFRKQAVHDTTAMQKNSVQGDVEYGDFVVGDRVMTIDGIAGRVANVAYGPFRSLEEYEVVLDNNMGGGTYTAGQLSPLGQQGTVSVLSVEAEAQLTAQLIEASTGHTANHDYPELGDILETRLPNENIKVYASFGVTDEGDTNSDDEEEEEEDPKDEADSNESDEDDDDVDGIESDNDEDAGPDIAPPDACSYCGFNEFEDPQMTGRGVRMRCGQCGGTMTSWGGQWQPEFPNSPANNASETWDTRSGGPGGVVQAPGANYKTTSLETDAGIKDWLYNRLPDSYKGGSELGTAYSRDWCRFRKNQHCWLPDALNSPASAQVGYAVFTPKDRGFCNRQTWPMQENCPVGQPGPNVGGQKYFSSLNDSELGWHFTAAWVDVQAKARRIRREGGVKILVAQGGYVVGEIQGDTAVYESRIQYVPGTKKQADWHCGCKWGAYSWGRSKPFRKFEGRNCSHVLALQYEAQARAMFGKDVREDSIRPAWQEPHSPIVEQYDRSTGQNLVRSSSLMMDSDGIYPNPSELDLVHPPIYAFAQSMLGQGEDPANVMSLLQSYGMNHTSAKELLFEAMNDPATGEVVVHGEVHQLTDVDPERNTVTLSNGQTVPSDHAKSPQWHPTLGLDPSDGSTGRTGALAGLSGMDEAIQYAPNTDVANALKHDQAQHKDDPKHRHHHTNDAREHAPDHNWGIAWGYGGGPVCGQCNGAGCGACAGTGQELGNTEGNNDTSPDQTPDAGDSVGMGGVEAALYHYLADLQDYPSNGEATNYNVSTQHSNTTNPGSTGFATSNDPGNWGDGILQTGFNSNFDASLHTALKEGEESIPPTVSGVALKAADTGRILMLQRGIHDPKDNAAGTWEFPGGHHEEGDQTSLHAGIREWEEEVGQPFPSGGHVSHTWRSGPYQGHVVIIPSEDDVQFHEGRSTVNPDNPDGDKHEQSAWWHPEDAAKNPALRDELKKNGPFKDIEKASALEESEPQPEDEEIDEAQEETPEDDTAPVDPDPQASETGRPCACCAGLGNHEGDPCSLCGSTGLQNGISSEPNCKLSILNDSPEPALPRTEAEGEEDPEDIGAIVAAFQQTAAARSMIESAPELKATIAKTSMKEFSFAEQQDLINEGAADKTLARNFGDLKIAGTHYELLGDEDDDNIIWT